MNLVHGKNTSEISQLLCLSERTIGRYLTLFRQTGDVKPIECRNGPQRLLGGFEQLKLLSLILQYPGIYIHEREAGVTVSAATIWRTLQFMGCARQVIRSVAVYDSLLEISIYEVYGINVHLVR